ncbi:MULTISPECIES: TetR/AcrR family transcriptional regulator [unclassified Nocardiopsis]|uniref:TetR/AcrR family transcriptional regulator n=1 Tax=unclassified Nocardiopsis TaxID=2649073 RepID=UPI001F1E1AEE|nr:MULTISPECIES: TetR/AcrR family transcriptional regulator [unclassified Nocardiopsis]
MHHTTQRGAQVRQRLLNAATDLIAQRGWNAVTTRTLAHHAGVGPGLVHYHFDSLQALLTEAATQTLRTLADEVTQHLQGTTPAQGLDLILRDLDRYPGDDPASRLVAETYLAATRDPALRHAVTDVLLDLRHHLTDWLQTTDIPDPRTTATALAAALDGVMLHRALTPEPTGTQLAPVLRRLLTHHEGTPA